MNEILSDEQIRAAAQEFHPDCVHKDCTAHARDREVFIAAAEWARTNLAPGRVRALQRERDLTAELRRQIAALERNLAARADR